LLSQAKDEEITAIKKEIEEAKDEEFASLKIQLQAKDEEIVMLKEAVAKAVGKASSTCEEVASLKRELADLETFASKRQQAAHNLASEMESLIASHEEKVAILNREMEAKDGEVMSLKRDLEVASGNSEDAESLKKAYSSELSAVVCKHAEEVSSLKGLIVAAEARLAEEVSSLSSRMEAAAAEHAEEMAIREEALTLGTERWSTAEEVMRAKVDALEGEVREERLRVEEREEELGEARELMRQMDER
jgi:chromosome segregation ATPase